MHLLKEMIGSKQPLVSNVLNVFFINTKLLTFIIINKQKK